MGSLTFVGLGLWDEKDVSLRGVEACREADVVLAEWYTAFLAGATHERLEAALGRPVRVLPREEVESGEAILKEAREKRVAFLTAGDPMTATTHLDLRLRAHKEGIATRIVHGASIATAASGLLGLQHYKFGRATTITFPQGNWFPTSPYDVIKENYQRKLHTLCLLDIRAAENRYMTAAEGAQLLLRMEDERKEGLLERLSFACAVARAGSPQPRVVCGQLGDLAEADLGPPLHVIVLPGELHFAEEEALVGLAEYLGA